jgi:hypothetical protein
MTLRARIIAAGLIVLAIVGGLKVYLLWPRWYGTEVLLRITLGARGGSEGVVAYFPDSRLRLDATNTQAANGKVEGALVEVRSLGVVWDSHHAPAEEAGRIRNRSVYLQLKFADTRAATGEALSRPVTISTTLVPGVLNLRVEVTSANTAAEINVGITGAGAFLPLKPGTAIDHASAILRVLPSGRHALVGVIAGGARIVW